MAVYSTFGEEKDAEAYAPSRTAVLGLMGTGFLVFSLAIFGGLVEPEKSGLSLISTPSLISNPPEESVWEVTRRVAEDLVAKEKVDKDDPLVETWGLGAQDRRGDTLQEIEEHIVKAPCFGEQTYAYWRFGLNRPELLAGKALRVHSHSYTRVDSMISALAARKISKDAIVFVDVRYTGLDTDWEYKELRDTANIDPDILLGGTQRASTLKHRGFDENSLDVTCVYDYTKNLLLRSRLLRAVLSYPEPLTVVISGDVACRLHTLPQTHHRIVLSNDAAGAQATQLGAFWWPQGLEGLQSYDFYKNPSATADTLSVTAARWQKANTRIFLLADSVTVNLRKPSRIHLVEALPTIRSELLELAQQNNLGLKLEVSIDNQVQSHENTKEQDSSIQFGIHDALNRAVHTLANNDFGGNTWRAQVASSVATLCPAGDVYSTGRVLTALYLGTIPIVDATYMTDGGVSSKGCDDPARFWRYGSPDFPHAAPFIFVDDWNQLPALLTELTANFPDNLNHRLELMAQYKSKLELYLRSIVVPPTKRKHQQSTTCTETPLDADDRARLLAAAADYYTPHWYDHHKDKPDVPGATCLHNITTNMYGVDIGAPCFDAACAPPLLKSFDCFPITDQPSFPSSSSFVQDDMATQQQLSAQLPAPRDVLKL